MGLIIGNFSSGWQNKARPELMKDSALFVCRDLAIDELGALRCRLHHTEMEVFKGSGYSEEVKNLFIVDVEGKSHRLMYWTVGSVLYRWNSYTGEIQDLSSSMTGGKVCYAPIKPVLSRYTYVYITDGRSMLCDNGVVTKTWGIDPPDGILMVSMSGSGGNIGSGTYSYRFTFYDGDTGSESDPSIASPQVDAVESDSAEVSQIAVSSNERVSKRRLYRTLNGGGVYYLVGPLNNNVVTEKTDNLNDDDLTVELVTDQGIPPLGDEVVSFKNRLFLSGDFNYPNRVYYSSTDKPDNWPSTNYLDVGTSDDEIKRMVEFEGKLYFLQTATISGLYGSDETTFAWHQTRSHVGIMSRWSAAVGPDGVYFLGQDGVYRFDGLKSVKVSEAIDRSFGLEPGEWWDVIDKAQAKTVARGQFLQGKYYLLVPMIESDGSTVNRLLVYNAFDQSWLEFDVECGDLLSDEGDGKVYGSLERPLSSGEYSVFELMNQIKGDDGVSIEALTKSFSIVGQEEKSRAVGWLRKFRVDCLGDWDVGFYVDGELVVTQSLSGQGALTRYQWYDFPPKTKGRYLSIKLVATGTPDQAGWVFNELEVV